jgi:hypothetical protein
MMIRGVHLYASLKRVLRRLCANDTRLCIKNVGRSATQTMYVRIICLLLFRDFFNCLRPNFFINEHT